MAELLRKYIVLPLGLCALGIVFVILCMLLLANKGNDQVLRKKLRIGALILALQAVAIQGAWSAGSCYERKGPEFALRNSAFESGVIDLNLKETRQIAATIKFGERADFSFAVIGKSMVIHSGAVNPSDGRMDSSDENVTLLIDPDKVAVGNYELRVFWGAAQSPAGFLRATPMRIYRLIVRDE